MRKEVKVIRIEDDIKSNVKLFVDRKVCIENMATHLELEIVREGVGTVKTIFKQSKLIPSDVRILSDYGLNIRPNSFDEAELAKAIFYTANEVDETFFHKGLGWYNLDEKLIFRSNNLIGSNVDSHLNDDNFILTKKGTMPEWVEGINNIVNNNHEMGLIIVTGFSSILTSLFNMDYSINSLILNIHGGISEKRDIIMQILNSIWGKPHIMDKGLYSIYKGDLKELANITEFNNGLTTLIKNTGKNSLVNLVNNIQSLSLDSTFVINSNEEIINEKNIGNILLRDNIIEIDLGINNCMDEKIEIGKVNMLFKENYGHAGNEFVFHLFEKGLANVKSEYELLLDEIISELNMLGLSENKAPKIAILLLSSKYLKESLEININYKQLKNTLMKLEQIIVREKQNYEIVLDQLIEYFYSNQSKFILNGEVVKKDTIGEYEINNEGDITKIIIESSEFNNFIKKIGYNRLSILRAWKSKDILEYEDKRYDKKPILPGRWTGNPRFIVAKIKGGGSND